MVCLLHAAFEGPGTIEPWARKRGHSFALVRVNEGEPLPHTRELDWLVVMGGPMGASDETAFPWLAAEKRLIRDAISRGRLVLGICLGAQLVANALGGSVYAGESREIGWHEVRATRAAASSRFFAGFPAIFPAFHWHGDTFEIPAGAMRTAESAAYPNQAFEYGSAVVALQFHLEATPRSVARLVDACGHELDGSKHVQSAAEILNPGAPFATTSALLEAVLEAMERG